MLVDNRGLHNPYINLAIEDYLVHNADCSEHSYLLLYVNRPSVIIGRNQCIYREVNFEYLRNNHLHIARRITGGGAVYHDEGNLSFCFITAFNDALVNNYRHFNQPVVNALRKAGVDAQMDERNNILCGGKKISGNAQFTNRKNIISHGTLLLNANLPVLRQCLRENDFRVESKAVQSVRSPVVNLQQLTPEFKRVEELAAYLVKELQPGPVYELSPAAWQAIEKIAEEKLQSFEWVYGRSPKTTVYKKEGIIEVENGVVVSTTIPGTGALAGVPYTYQKIKTALGNKPNAAQLLQHLF